MSGRRQHAGRNALPALASPVPGAGDPGAAAALRGARGACAGGAAVPPGGLRGALHAGAAEEGRPAPGRRAPGGRARRVIWGGGPEGRGLRGIWIRAEEA